MTLLNTSLLAMTAIFSLTAFAQDIPNRPKWSGSFVWLSANEYLVAEDHPSLDAELSDVMTLEFWIRLDDPLPLPYQQATLFFKPNSWALVIRAEGERENPQKDFPLIPISTVLSFVPLGSKAQFPITQSWGYLTPGQWQHFHLSLRFLLSDFGETWQNNGAGFYSVDARLPKYMTNSNAPLYIGDVLRKRIDALGDWEFPYNPFILASMSLDEIFSGNGRILPSCPCFRAEDMTVISSTGNGVGVGRHSPGSKSGSKTRPAVSISATFLAKR